VSELFTPGPIAWVQRLFGPGHPEWFWVLSELGTPWGVVLVLALALLRWERADAYAVGGIVVVNALAALLMNQLFDVARPNHPSIVRYEIIEIGSFPSGHTVLAALLWGVLYVRGRVRLWVPALVVFLVGLSRLYLGVHFLGDVLGAAVIAAAILAAYGPLWRRAEGWLARRPPRVFEVVGALGVAGIAAGLAAGLVGSGEYEREALGLVLGAVPALLLERRLPRPAAPRTGAAVGLVLLGVVPLALLHRLGGESHWEGLLLIGAAALWALLAVPAILHRRRVRV
jgi:glycerophosphoryl diester phosphodiesterase